jgi:endonuclease YncB( thermonuclease family)
MGKTRRRYAMSRKKKNILFLMFFFFIVPVLVTLDRMGGVSLRQSIGHSLYTGTDWKKYHEKTFSIASVIDGDTIDLAIPDAKYPTTRVRLLGVDTPETKNPKTGVMYYGPEASAFTKKMCENQQVTVILDTVADQRDKYGRLLAYIRLPDGSILNQRLIAEGFGYADLRFEHSFSEQYAVLQGEVIRNKKGLWESVNRAQFPEWLRRERPDLLRESNQIRRVDFDSLEESLNQENNE